VGHYFATEKEKKQQLTISYQGFLMRQKKRFYKALKENALNGWDNFTHNTRTY